MVNPDRLTRMQEVCLEISRDMERDTVAREGQAFTGRLVGEALGQQAAAIQALANTLHELLTSSP